MTTQSIVENIQTIFPSLEERRIIKDLSDLQKSFANKTELLTARGALSSPSTNVAWVLPDDFVGLYGEDPVRFYNSDGEPLYLSGDSYNYAYEIQFGKLYIYSLNSTGITGLNSDISSAYVHYRKNPATVSSRSDDLEIDDEFSKALEHGLLADYFSKFPTPMLTRQGDMVNVRDINSANWHLQRYLAYRREAKIHARVKEYDRHGNAQIYQDAGEYQLPLRGNDSSLGSTIVPQLTALGNIYAKYVLYYFNTGDSLVIAPQISPIGFTPVATKTGDEVVITSVGEFGTDINVIANDGGVSWVYDSSSQLTITLPSVYTSIAIEIWERL